jgi:hypothetical protein
MSSRIIVREAAVFRNSTSSSLVIGWLRFSGDRPCCSVEAQCHKVGRPYLSPCLWNYRDVREAALVVRKVKSLFPSESNLKCGAPGARNCGIFARAIL